METDSPTRQLHIGDFPAALHDEIAERLALYSVGFTSVRRRREGTESIPSGSGTFVRIAGRHAFLTADHVAEQLQAGDMVSILVDWRGEVRRCLYERDHLVFARLARGADDGNGPDLALVFIPVGGEASATVRTTKLAYDLDRRIAELPGKYPGVEWGFWFPCGVPAEGAVELGPVRAFEQVRGVQGLCALAPRPREFELDSFDYFDLSVPAIGPDIPTNLGGMSGSGLWQVRIRQATDGTIYVQDHILSGMAFYEWYAPERRLRCHARRSLHERLPALLYERLGWTAPPGSQDEPV